MRNNNLEDLFVEFVNERRYSTRRSSETIRGYEATFKLLQRIIPGITMQMLTPKTMNEFFKRLDSRDRIVGKGQIKHGIKIKHRRHLPV